MHISRYPLRWAMSLLLASTALYSCVKETSSTDLDPHQQAEASLITTEAEAGAELIFNDVFDNVIGVNNEVGIQGTGVFSLITNCFTSSITRLSSTGPFPLRI